MLLSYDGYNRLLAVPLLLFLVGLLPASGALHNRFPDHFASYATPRDVQTSGMESGTLDQFIRTYIERVVNRHDLSGVDDMVSPSYTGGGFGWAENIEGLRAFYERQKRTRPGWRIDIQETTEVGEWIAVRALAGGIEAYNDDGSPQSPPFLTAVEWLAIFHVIDIRIVATRVISIVNHSPSGPVSDAY